MKLGAEEQGSEPVSNVTSPLLDKGEGGLHPLSDRLTKRLELSGREAVKKANEGLLEEDA